MTGWTSAGGAVGQPDQRLAKATVAAALAIAEQAWNDVVAAGRISRRHWEPRIAEELAGAVEDRVEAMADPLPFRVEQEVGTRRCDQRRNTGRVDIKLIYGLRKYDFLMIECKRVRKQPTALSRAYVADGIMRFVNGLYFNEHEWGIMFGFVIDGDVDGSAAAVQQEIGTHPDVALVSAFAVDGSWGITHPVHSSRHTRQPTNDTVTLLHLFFLV